MSRTVRRAWHPVQLGGLRKSPTSAAQQLVDIFLRKRLDLARLFPGIGRGVDMPMIVSPGQRGMAQEQGGNDCERWLWHRRFRFIRVILNVVAGL
jgi:hypothetical protein